MICYIEYKWTNWKDDGEFVNFKIIPKLTPDIKLNSSGDCVQSNEWEIRNMEGYVSGNPYDYLAKYWFEYEAFKKYIQSGSWNWNPSFKKLFERMYIHVNQYLREEKLKRLTYE